MKFADVKFDLNPRRDLVLHKNGENEKNNDDKRVNSEICLKATPSKSWELDVKGMVSTKKWLQNYGLKKNRLDMHQILQQIGFKHSDGRYTGSPGGFV